MPFFYSPINYIIIRNRKTAFIVKLELPQISDNQILVHHRILKLSSQSSASTMHIITIGQAMRPGHEASVVGNFLLWER